MTHPMIERAMLVFACVEALSACSSDGSKAGGTGGASSVDGTTGMGASTSGGASSTGGAGVGTGTPATGGGIGTGGVGLDCTASDTAAAPTGGLIADFTDPEGGISVSGARLLAFPVGSPSAPTYSIENGALHVTVNTPATSASQYLGVVIAFGYTCMDATAFSGVQFSISGSFSGCAMHYATCDVEHQDVTSGAPHATGPAGSYQPQFSIASSQVTATVDTLRVPFGAQLGGSPLTPIDKAKIILALWQFDVPPATGTVSNSCVVDITIDDVELY
jgi:hypothetical protein